MRNHRSITEWESEQNQNNFKGPKPVPRKFIRSATITNPESKQDSTEVWGRNNQGRENYKLKEEIILGDEFQTIQASLFRFGMFQTAFQIMVNWPVRFRNNIDDSPTHFLDDLLWFKRGCRINEKDILENLDAVLVEEAKS